MDYIWRIQNKEGVGPYYGDVESGSWWDHNHNGCPNHPAPIDDRGLGIYRFKWIEPIRFGFVNLEQLNHWFSQAEQERLAELGFHVVRVKGNIVAVSEFQCIFEPLIEEENK